MTVQAETTPHQAAYTSAIYGVVSVAAVICAWEADGNEWHLIEVITGYLLALWLTHFYARLVSTGEFTSWRRVLRHEFPVAGAGLPALGVAIIGQIANWGLEETSVVALTACGVTLVAIQTAIVRHHGAGRRRLLLTVVCDMVCAAVIVYLHIVI